MVLSLAANHGWNIQQLDFEVAFLNAPLKETVYVKPPDGYPDRDKYVWRLNKALYGLKQAPRAWHQELHAFVLSLGYSSCITDPCIFTKHTTAGVVILVLYVDDTLATFHPNDAAVWEQDKQQLAAKYRIKDLGQVDFVLNMKVLFSNGAILLSQQAYIEKMLLQFRMDDCKSVANPIGSLDIIRDTQPDEPALNPSQHTLYRSIVGALLYASNMTRVDIAFAVGMLCRHVSKPTQRHLTAAKHVLKYLSGTKTLALKFGGATTITNTPIEVYTDASWANQLHCKGTTGILIKLNGDVIAWAVRKQPTVSLSSCEAELLALCGGAQEIRWLQQWLEEVMKINTHGVLLSDSKSAIAIAAHDAIHNRTKHIDIKYFFIRDHVHKGHIKLHWVEGKRQHADILTKAMDNGAHRYLTSILLHPSA
jgi:histone deacetylase 1/2